MTWGERETDTARFPDESSIMWLGGMTGSSTSLIVTTMFIGLRGRTEIGCQRLHGCCVIVIDRACCSQCLDVRQLEYFVKVAEVGSFRGALIALGLRSRPSGASPASRKSSCIAC